MTGYFDYRRPSKGLRAPAYDPAWPRTPKPPVLWSIPEKQALVRLHDRWGVTGDLFTAPELARLSFLRYLLSAGQVGRD